MILKTTFTWLCFFERLAVMSDGFILSVMGESEIETFEVQLKNKRMSSQVHDTIEDQVNWLGSILDVGADKI